MTSQSLAKLCEGMPEAGIDFEYCAVQHREERKFTITNTEGTTVHYDVVTDLEAGTMFVVTPATGKLLNFHLI